MTILESIKRLGWRLKTSVKENRPIKVNQSDVDAYNTIAKFYENQIENNYKTNELCFKMYVWHRVEMMKHYKSDIFDTITQKELARRLNMPLETFITAFKSFLNQSEYKVLANKTDGDKPYFIQSKSEKEQSLKNLEAMLKENPDLFKTLTGDVWSYEDVKDNLVAEYNQLLNTIGTNNLK